MIQPSFAEVSLPDPVPNVELLPGKLRILVVEDDEADAYLIRKALTKDTRVGSVTRAVDGVEALDLLDDREVAPDLAIIDLHMPRMDGFRLLVQLSCRPERAFPLVVLTSSGVRADLVRSRVRGADQVMTKPDTLNELEGLLRLAIGNAYRH